MASERRTRWPRSRSRSTRVGLRSAVLLPLVLSLLDTCAVFAIEPSRSLRRGHRGSHSLPGHAAVSAARVPQAAPIKVGEPPEPASSAQGQDSAPASLEPASPGGVSSGWTIHHVFGTLIFASFGCFLCLVFPIVRREREFYEESVKDSGESFQAYLRYRFMDWFTQQQMAPSLVLLFITLSLIVTGALIYALVVGGSPSHALWRIFVWSTGSPAEGEVTGGGRFLGTLVTVCGLIILSLLLGIVTESFGTKMAEIKSGQSRIVEGGHTVILGYSECTRCLVEELAKARESDGGGVIAILTKEDKVAAEAELCDGLNLLGSRVIVRSGNPCQARDLQKVAVASASQVVVLADTQLCQEEADARSIRTLLSLKTKEWPSNGHIVVQCSSEPNREMLKTIYCEDGDKVEVVVVGGIVATLMARSATQPGLASVFGDMLGFDHDEFYIKDWPELVGCPFRDIVFRFPDAVIVGILTAEGDCKLNPGWMYKLAEGDRIVALAEDNDTYLPRDEPWFELATPSDAVAPRMSQSETEPAVQGASKTLIVGWNREMGPFLKALEDVLAPDSSINLYSVKEVEDRRVEIAEFEHQLGHKFERFSIKHFEVDEDKLTSQHELSRLDPHTYDKVFILSDAACDRSMADERMLAHLAQLRFISSRIPEKDRKAFDPTIEVCEDSTKDQLAASGFRNIVHSSSLVSKTLAAVTEDPSIYGVYQELMSGQTNQFEFRPLGDFFPNGKAPEEISFWEAAHQVSEAGDISVVAWSVPNFGGDEASGNSALEFEINPKDKLTRRKWRSQDRLAVIRGLAESNAA